MNAIKFCSFMCMLVYFVRPAIAADGALINKGIQWDPIGVSLVEPQVSSKEGKFSLSVHTKVIYTSAQPDRPDIAYSHINLAMGTHPGYANLEKFLADFSSKRGSDTQLRADNVDFLATFSISISGLPFLLKDYVNSNAQKEVDAQLAKAKNGLLAQLRRKLLLDPQLLLLPPAQRQIMIDRILAAAATQIDGQLALKREALYEQLTSRLNKMQMDTAIQEVAIGFAKVLRGSDAVIFVRAGRGWISTGSPLNDAGVSELTDLRPREITTNAAPRGTLFSTVGMQKNLDDQGNYLRVETTVFDNKQPFNTLDSYVHRMLTMEQAQFDREMEFFNINSQLIRLFLKYQDAEVYLATINYDGTIGFTAGVLYHVTKKDAIRVDVAHNNPLFDTALQVFYIRDITNWLRGYGGLQVFKDLNLNGDTPKSGTSVQPVIGVAMRILQLSFKQLVLVWELSGELGYDTSTDNPTWGIGTKLEAKF